MLRYHLLFLVLVAILKHTSSRTQYKSLKSDRAFEEEQTSLKKAAALKEFEKLVQPFIPLRALENTDNTDNFVDSDNFVNPDGYNNDYDGILNFECSSYSAVNSIKSVYSSSKHDREFMFTCDQVTDSYTPFVSCDWSGYVQKWNGILSFDCKQNYVMTSTHSVFSKKRNDRRWKFQCCQAKNYITESCTSTGYLNKFGASFSHSTKGLVFTGMFSWYSPKNKDRLYQVTACNYTTPIKP